MKLNKKESKTTKTKYRQAEVFASFIEGKESVELNVLDVGCGQGEYVHWYGLNNFSALGIDLQEIFINTARNISLDKSIVNVEFLVDDCSTVPHVCKKKKYDLILFVGSRVVDSALYDITQIVKLINEYRDLLTVNGKIIIFELTDFSGRIEEKAGWRMKTRDEIDFILSSFKSSGAKLHYMRGFARLPMIWKYNSTRKIMSFLWNTLSPKYLNYLIVISAK